MLVEFSVVNFRSMRDRQTLSMIKAKGHEREQSNTFKAQAFREYELLRSAALYGPNAGGKSNFLKGLQTMRAIVTESAKDMQRGDPIPVTPFRLQNDTRKAPCEFEVTFIVDRVRYQYGFSADEERIHEEWLLAYPKGRSQRWFERIWNEPEDKYRWEFGTHLSGEKQIWQKSTRTNALFLSTAVHLNSEQLQPVYDWFEDTLRIVGIAGLVPGFSARLCDIGEKYRIMDFLHAADMDIEDIIVEKKPFDPLSLPDDMPDEFKATLTKDLKDTQFLDIKTIRKDLHGEAIAFDFDQESDGTQKLFSFFGPWIDALENGYVLVIDELHSNLHPRLVQYLVDLFHSDETNPRNAQLVFTTHETSILSQDIFRRDQIWFCEKDKDHATTLYPLSDFSPRKGEALEKAYLSGRYGGLPYIRPLKTSS